MPGQVLPWARPVDGGGGQEGVRQSERFPWRCNLLRFWEAEVKGGWGAGGAIERWGGLNFDDLSHSLHINTFFKLFECNH